MTKIEELKAAYAAATPGEPIKAYVWEGDDASGVTVFYGTPNRDGDLSYEQVLLEQDFDNVYDNSPALFEFITLAHNLMPQLLEAVEVLKAVVPLMDIAFNYDGDVFGRQHNNATDVYSAAECVLRGLK